MQHFLVQARRELEKSVSSVAPETLEILRAYPWPGNIRELQSVIKQAVLKSVGPVLVPDFLPPFVSGEPLSETAGAELDESLSSQTESVMSATSPDVESATVASEWDEFVATAIESGSRSIYDDAVRLAEKQVLSRVLRHTSGNQVKASELLGITRTTLRNKIKQHGITIDRTIGE